MLVATPFKEVDDALIDEANNSIYGLAAGVWSGNTAKAQQIAANARVAITFLWTALERQVNITGRAVQTSREESAEYFASRPRAA